MTPPAKTGLKFKLICKHLGPDSDLSYTLATLLGLSECFPADAKAATLPSKFSFFLHFVLVDLGVNDFDEPRKAHTLAPGRSAKGGALSAARVAGT